jgi:GntR family phosphonate transport system transcriptional regulator
MPRTPIWSSIAANLTAEIAAGTYAQGTKLPTEAQLALRFGVNRHTVRRALGALAEAGVVQPRRGAGVFVTSVPTEYPLGRRVRFTQNVLASGRTPSRRLLRSEIRPASADGQILPKFSCAGPQGRNSHGIALCRLAPRLSGNAS